MFRVRSTNTTQALIFFGSSAIPNTECLHAPRDKTTLRRLFISTTRGSGSLRRQPPYSTVSSPHSQSERTWGC